MITENESQDIYDVGKYYVILPGKDKLQVQRKKYPRFVKHKKIKYGFSYSSENNSDFLNLTDLKRLVKNYMK